MAIHFNQLFDLMNQDIQDNCDNFIKAIKTQDLALFKKALERIEYYIYEGRLTDFSFLANALNLLMDKAGKPGKVENEFVAAVFQSWLKLPYYGNDSKGIYENFHNKGKSKCLPLNKILFAPPFKPKNLELLLSHAHDHAFAGDKYNLISHILLLAGHLPLERSCVKALNEKLFHKIKSGGTIDPLDLPGKNIPLEYRLHVLDIALDKINKLKPKHEKRGQLNRILELSFASNIILELVMKDDVKTIKALSKKGILLHLGAQFEHPLNNKQPLTTKTPYQLAVEENKPKVRAFLEQTDNGFGGEILINLARENNLRGLQFWLNEIKGKVNRSIGAMDRENNTALAYAVVNNNLQMVKCLLQNKDITANSINSKNESPLYLAIANANQHREPKGKFDEELARTYHEDRVEIIRSLVQARASFGIKYDHEQNDKNPLYFALEINDQPGLKVLFEQRPAAHIFQEVLNFIEPHRPGLDDNNELFHVKRYAILEHFHSTLLINLISKVDPNLPLFRSRNGKSLLEILIDIPIDQFHHWELLKTLQNSRITPDELEILEETVRLFKIIKRQNYPIKPVENKAEIEDPYMKLEQEARLAKLKQLLDPSSAIPNSNKPSTDKPNFHVKFVIEKPICNPPGGPVLFSQSSYSNLPLLNDKQKEIQPPNEKEKTEVQQKFES